MADDPLRGFGERIVKRARLPVAVLLALPFAVVAIEYFFYLVQNGFGITGAVEQIKKDAPLFVGLGALPAIILAFSRELEVHELLDKLLGVRASVDADIRTLLRGLAERSGYDHPDRILNAPTKAREWFYSFVNEQPVLRLYAFELWEAYYVGLYISLASLLSFVVLAGVAIFVARDAIVWSFPRPLCTPVFVRVGCSSLVNCSEN